MELLKEILKGILIGIANIIPGVSGGTMAVSMGIYDKLISSLTNLFHDTKNSIKTLFPYVIGAGIGIGGLSFAIEFLFKQYPIQTNCLFIGLIVGGLPMLFQLVKGRKLGIANVVAFLLFFFLVTGLAIIGEQEGAQVALNANISSLLKLFGVGVIASATMVIPGVSGSMILILIGYYHPIIQQINAFLSALANKDINALWQGFCILFPFGMGIVIGIFVIAKIIELLLEHIPGITFCGIIGLIVASPVAIILMNDFSRINITNGIMGILCFIVGGMIAIKLGNE